MDIIKSIESEQLKSDIPEFRPGDTVKVHVKIKEKEFKSLRALLLKDKMVDLEKLLQ